MREAWVRPTAEEAKETWRDGVMGKHRFYYSAGDYSEEADPWLEGIYSAEELSFEQLEDDRFVIGDPQDGIDYIEECHEPSAPNISHSGSGSRTAPHTRRRWRRFGSSARRSSRTSKSSRDGPSA